MQDLAGYGVGGTIHVIVNNQIGFTTNPCDARSGQYCSDLAKAIDAPILHVNADSMDDVAKVFQFAAKYRQMFHSDIVIDIIGYRRAGHNELDQPMFTQPLMYKIIQKMPNVAQIYEKEMLDQGVVNQTELEAIKKEIKDELERAY